MRVTIMWQRCNIMLPEPIATLESPCRLAARLPARSRRPRRRPRPRSRGPRPRSDCGRLLPARSRRDGSVAESSTRPPGGDEDAGPARCDGTPGDPRRAGLRLRPGWQHRRRPHGRRVEPDPPRRRPPRMVTMAMTRAFVTMASTLEGGVALEGDSIVAGEHRSDSPPAHPPRRVIGRAMGFYSPLRRDMRGSSSIRAMIRSLGPGGLTSRLRGGTPRSRLARSVSRTPGGCSMRGRSPCSRHRPPYSRPLLISNAWKSCSVPGASSTKDTQPSSRPFTRSRWPRFASGSNIGVRTWPISAFPRS